MQDWSQHYLSWGFAAAATAQTNLSSVLSHMAHTLAVAGGHGDAAAIRYDLTVRTRIHCRVTQGSLRIQAELDATLESRDEQTITSILNTHRSSRGDTPWQGRNQGNSDRSDRGRQQNGKGRGKNQNNKRKRSPREEKDRSDRDNSDRRSSREQEKASPLDPTPVLPVYPRAHLH